MDYISKLRQVDCRLVQVEIIATDGTSRITRYKTDTIGDARLLAEAEIAHRLEYIHRRGEHGRHIEDR